MGNLGGEIMTLLRFFLTVMAGLGVLLLFIYLVVLVVSLRYLGYYL